MFFVLLSDEQKVEIEPKCLGRWYRANMTLKKIVNIAYAMQIYSVVSSFKWVFDESTMDKVIAKAYLEGRKVK